MGIGCCFVPISRLNFHIHLSLEILFSLADYAFKNTPGWGYGPVSQSKRSAALGPLIKRITPPERGVGNNVSLVKIPTAPPALLSGEQS